MPIPLNLRPHWDFSDPAASEQRFTELMNDPEIASDRANQLEVLTQVARARGLQRRIDEAHAALDEVERELEAMPDRVRVRYLLERGRALNSAGKRGDAGPLFEEAYELARQAPPLHGLAVDAAHMVAIVKDDDEALQWNQTALALAVSSDHPDAARWKAPLYNNIGWTLHERGDFDEALESFRQALEARIDAGEEGQIRIARWAVARALRSLQRLNDALDMLQELLVMNKADGTEDAYVYEELAELHLELQYPDEAREFFAQAHALLSQDGWFVANEAERLERMERMAYPWMEKWKD